MGFRAGGAAEPYNRVQSFGWNEIIPYGPDGESEDATGSVLYLEVVLPSWRMDAEVYGSDFGDGLLFAASDLDDPPEDTNLELYELNSEVAGAVPAGSRRLLICVPTVGDIFANTVLVFVYVEGQTAPVYSESSGTPLIGEQLRILLSSEGWWAIPFVATSNDASPPDPTAVAAWFAGSPAGDLSLNLPAGLTLQVPRPEAATPTQPQAGGWELSEDSDAVWGQP